MSLLGSGWLSFTYVHHGNWGWALALCTSWQGEGFNLHVHIFHYKGNNSGDGLTSPVTTGTVVLYISGWYSGNVVDFREQKCQHDYYLSHTAARVLDDQASLSTFLLTVLTIILNVLFLNPACHFFLHIYIEKKINKMKDHDLEKWFLFIAEYRSTKTEDVYIYINTGQYCMCMSLHVGRTVIVHQCLKERDTHIYGAYYIIWFNINYYFDL